MKDLINDGEDVILSTRRKIYRLSENLTLPFRPHRGNAKFKHRYFIMCPMSKS